MNVRSVEAIWTDRLIGNGKVYYSRRSLFSRYRRGYEPLALQKHKRPCNTGQTPWCAPPLSVLGRVVFHLSGQKRVARGKGGIGVEKICIRGPF